MPWLNEVDAVVQAWHPGQQFGAAIAVVLFGDADPGGRLPLTFLATPEQGPITRPEQYPGVDGDAHYDEGIYVGYRWYDAHDQQPLFPFGHGLSYGDFRYGEPRLDVDDSTGTATVSVEIANVGDRPACDVAQLYVAAPEAADEPPRQLRGFAKVRLAAGAATTVTFPLTADDLAAYDEASGRWTVHDGRYDLVVGRSSRDVQGTTALDVTAGRLSGEPGTAGAAPDRRG
jgi:beta-glucosidase